MEPGFYTADELSNEEYHSGPGVSASGLKLIGRSLAHYREYKHEETREQFRGTAIHAAALEPDKFDAEYIVAEGFERRNEAGFKAWSAKQDRLILMPDEYKNVIGMRDALHNHPVVGPLLAGAVTELSCYANDPETGVLCRCRFDMVAANGWILDLKKCQDARTDAVAGAISRYEYYLQNAFYMDVPTWATGQPPAGFAFVFVEEKPPHGISVRVLHPDDVDRGRVQYRRALNKINRAATDDHWPCYPAGIEIVELSPWKRKELDFNNEEN